MVIKHSRMLKVSTSKGERIIAEIRSIEDSIRIKVKFNELVKQDNPSFAKDGVIVMTCKREDYQKTLQHLTKYFEDLFLKGLSNENTNTSTRISNDSRGNKEQTESYSIGVDPGKGSDSSVYSRSRRTKSTKSPRAGFSSAKVDKISNKDVSTEDKVRH